MYCRRRRRCSFSASCANIYVIYFHAIDVPTIFLYSDPMASTRRSESDDDDDVDYIPPEAGQHMLILCAIIVALMPFSVSDEGSSSAEDEQPDLKRGRTEISKLSADEEAGKKKYNLHDTFIQLLNLFPGLCGTTFRLW